jgi:2-amino-4-hydroxy-6-hydroxymethyldihydropteridine diphosphokinase
LKDKDQVFLLLGGNIGNVEETFFKAIQRLSDFARVVKTSAIYISEAWGMTNAAPFLNQAVLITTDLAPLPLLAKLKEIELETGPGAHRNIEGGYQSRKLDIDILMWGQRTITSDELTIPHPRMHKRNFTLAPLAELAPDIIHPVLQKSISDLLAHSVDTLKVEKK